MRPCAAVYKPVRIALTVGLLAVAAPILRTQVVFRPGVDLVSVTVTVTDRNGRFVPDLKQSDFTVLDDGKPQEITYAMPHDKDGASHAIKAEVRKRRVIVRTRSGYVASAPLGPK